MLAFRFFCVFFVFFVLKRKMWHSEDKINALYRAIRHNPVVICENDFCTKSIRGHGGSGAIYESLLYEYIALSLYV